MLRKLFGLLFAVIAIFMLYTSIRFQSLYLETMGAPFKDVWQNCVQFVIEKSAVYVGIAALLLFPGKRYEEKVGKRKAKHLSEEEAEQEALKACTKKLGTIFDCHYRDGGYVSCERVGDTFRAFIGINPNGKTPKKNGYRYYATSFVDMDSGKTTYGDCVIS